MATSRWYPRPRRSRGSIAPAILRPGDGALGACTFYPTLRSSLDSDYEVRVLPLPPSVSIASLPSLESATSRWSSQNHHRRGPAVLRPGDGALRARDEVRHAHVLEGGGDVRADLLPREEADRMPTACQSLPD